MLLCSVARGQAPSYSAAGIVNAANFAPGPFAPNSVVSLFGTNLSNSPDGVAATQAMGVSLPAQLANVGVYVQNMVAPVLYVSPTQVNFLVPANLAAGTAPVRVVKQGVTGPTVNIAIVAGAPALFPSADGIALAVDWNNGNAPITTDRPAHAGDVIIVYATGLGAAGVMTTGEVPSAGIAINNIASLKVTLGGLTVNPALIQYAGLTPGWAGLYQINLTVPGNVGTNPEISVAMGDQASPAGLKLAVQ